MFEGSKDAPGEYMQRIEKLGGSANAGTGLDVTNYFETMRRGAGIYAVAGIRSPGEPGRLTRSVSTIRNRW